MSALDTSKARAGAPNETSTFEFHELCLVFPEMDANDLAALTEDIRVNRQREPIVLLDGKILDWRNRYLACLHADFEPTFQEFDGSDSGARPDEAISWGKIRIDAKPVKVYADASLVLPLLTAMTFAKEVDRRAAK